MPCSREKVWGKKRTMLYGMTFFIFHFILLSEVGGLFFLVLVKDEVYFSLSLWNWNFHFAPQYILAAHSVWHALFVCACIGFRWNLNESLNVFLLALNGVEQNKPELLSLLRMMMKVQGKWRELIIIFPTVIITTQSQHQQQILIRGR
jgi:hypothetical protein